MGSPVGSKSGRVSGYDRAFRSRKWQHAIRGVCWKVLHGRLRSRGGLVPEIGLDEAVADAWLRIWNYWGKVRVARSPLAMASRVAKFAVLDLVRSYLGNGCAFARGVRMKFPGLGLLECDSGPDQESGLLRKYQGASRELLPPQCAHLRDVLRRLGRNDDARYVLSGDPADRVPDGCSEKLAGVDSRKANDRARKFTRDHPELVWC